MSYAEQRDPRKNAIGLAAVVGFHILLIYGLVNGLGQKVVDVIKKPLSVSIIEAVKTTPPPPPPPKVIPPTPKVVAAPPPPAFVPPPEVPVVASPQNAVITKTEDPTPPPPPKPVAPPAPVAPAIVSASVACPNFEAVRNQVPYPAQAERMGLSGDVTVEFTVGANGEVKDISAVRSTNALFANAATKTVAKFSCVGQGRDVRVRVPFSFRLN